MNNVKAAPDSLLTRSQPGDVWVAPVHAIPAVLTEFGIVPAHAFLKASVDLQQFQDPENRMPIDEIGRLLEVCVALTNCPAFGLLVGQRFSLTNLGPLGQQLRNAATVGSALHTLLKYLYLYDRGAALILLTKDQSSVTLGYSMYRHGTPGVTYALDAVMAIAYRILRELCGPTWKPLRVQFAYKQPGEITKHRSTFKSNVAFDAEVSAIVFARKWLEMPIAGADPGIHELVADANRHAELIGIMNFAERVEAVMPQMVLNGTETAGEVAEYFALHERTLRRYLKEEQRSFQGILNQTRCELAQQLLGNTSLSVERIATVLRYRDPNAFSRAFRNWSRLSPTQWRALQ